MNSLTTEYIDKNMPKLGFGLMRLPLLVGSDEIDIEQFKEMVDCYMSNGMNYFDTAYMYHDGKSEAAFKEAVVKRYPREAYAVADKLPVWYAQKTADIQKIFDEQLRRTGVDYFDYYLHHSMNTELDLRTIELGGYELIKKLKADGKIRHIGFSFHGNAEALKKILTQQPQMEFVQLQINYYDWNDDAREFYEIARSFNKPIIVMEPVKGGILSKMPPHVSEIFTKADPAASPASLALRYCASLDGVMTVLSGMSDMKQMKDNVSFMKAPKPLTAEEYNIIGKVERELRAVPAVQCTACKYCADCPVGIPIHDIIKIYNSFIKSKSIWQFGQDYAGIPTAKRAGKCIKCGKCEEVCPQSLNIISTLEEVVRLIE